MGGVTLQHSAFGSGRKRPRFRKSGLHRVGEALGCSIATRASSAGHRGALREPTVAERAFTSSAKCTPRRHARPIARTWSASSWRSALSAIHEARQLAKPSMSASAQTVGTHGGKKRMGDEARGGRILAESSHDDARMAR